MATTTVTGTVVDPDGIAWANGQVIMQLINPNPNIQPSVGGVPLTFNQMNIVANLDGAGAFSQAVTSTSSIVPALTQWRVTFDSNTSAVAQSLSIQQINGASLSLNTQIAAQIQAIRLGASPSTRAYADIEIMSPPPSGATYYNVTSNVTRQWNGSAWVNAGSGGGSSSVNVIYASSISGCVLDCVVNPALPNVGKTSSGSAPTDNTSRINAQITLMAASSTGACELIIDGGTACTGIILPSGGNFAITGIGRNSGFFMLTGSNSHAIYNNGKSGAFDPGPPAPSLGGWIRLSNFTINGNRGNGTTGNSTTGDPRGIALSYWYSNIDLANIDGVTIENMYSYDAPAYNMRFNNCSKISVRGNVIKNPCTTFTLNNDGVHIDGPCTDARVENNYISNNGSDDGVAYNMPEGYSGAGDKFICSGNTFDVVRTAMRVYGNTAAFAFQTLFDNNVVASTVNGVLIGAGIAGAQDSCSETIQISNSSFIISGGSTSSPIAIWGNIGDLNISNVIWNGPQSINPFIQGQFAGATISNLTIHNCHIYRNNLVGQQAAPLLGATAGLTIKRMTIDNCQIVDEAGQSYTAVAAALSMGFVTITSLYVANIDYTKITTLASDYTNIGNLYGNFQPEFNISTQTNGYTTLPPDRTLLGDSTAGGIAFNVPAKAYKGQKHTYKNIGTANNLTITGTIDGSANPTLGTKAFMTIEFDGTNWQKVG